MMGDEAIALISLTARAEIADAFDPETGRIWLGGREDHLREGLRRIGTELTALFD